MEKRVVVTGMGSISPAGSSNEKLWQKLLEAKPLFSPVTDMGEDYKVKYAGYVKDFDPDEFVDPRAARRMSKFTVFAAAAAKIALDDSGILESDIDRDLFGVIIGSGIGGADTLSAEATNTASAGFNRVSPTLIPAIIPNMASGFISQTFDLRGESFATVSACSTGAHAIGEAYRIIKHGYNKAVLAGGTEAGLFPLGVAGFANMKALNTADDINLASIPFDKRRGGFVLSEGSAILVLEEYENAVKRGAHIYGEIVGYGATSDAYHFTSPRPDGSGASKAMRLAMNDAGIGPEAIGYINAHGTGTAMNDKIETLAIKDAFGEYVKKVAISSTKGVIGHLLGAAGAIEALITLLALEKGTLPPTAGLCEPDEECDLDYIPLKARESNTEYAMSNSLAFGGANASLIFRKFGK